MDEKYRDPANVAEIITSIKEAQTLGDCIKIVETHYPNWILGIMDGYSSDYPSLDKNWEEICSKNRIEKKKIVLVEYCFFDDSHRLISVVCEILTLSGFCVRTKNDLFPCNSCGYALPQSHVYDLLKGKGEQIPENWSVYCEKC